MQNKSKKNKKIVSDERLIEKKNYFSAIELIKKIALQNTKLNFVFRPHPRQDLKKVKERFKGYKNIFVEYKYSITPWIYQCDLFIHSGCTTVFEALAMEKKVISYIKYKNKFRKNSLYFFGKHTNSEFFFQNI